MYRNILYFFVLASILVACNNAENQTQETAAVNATTTNSAEKPVVEVVKPQQRIFESQLEITGNLEANQMATLYAMEGGMVGSILKDIGDKVNAGQVIATLRNPELVQQAKHAAAELAKANGQANTTKANLKKAQAQLSFKQKSYDRLKAIYDKTPDLVTINDMESAEAAWMVAAANVESVEAENANAQTFIQSAQALLNAFQARTNMLQVKAPFTGFITKRYVDKGALVTNGLNNSNARPIVDIIDVSKLRLIVDYPESDLATIAKGSKVQVKFPEVAGMEYAATISRLSAALNPQTKTVRAEIDLEDKSGKLKPGMYAKVNTLQKSERSSLSVPTQAITAVKGKNFVFVLENNKVKKIPVELGMEDRYFIEILNKDLKSNHLVITQGKGLVNEGMEVDGKLKE